MRLLASLLPFAFLALSACAAGGGSASSEGNSGGGAGNSGGGGDGGGNIFVDGGQGGGNVEACLSNTFGADAEPANLMFQLDVSGSMNCQPTDAVCATGDPNPTSRWEVFKKELIKALQTLPDATGAGLFHYPTGKGSFSGNPTGCIPQTPDVALGPLSATRAAITTKLNAILPEGGTPTHDAVNVALAALSQANVQGNKFLVLATDGQATFCTGCNLFCSSAEQTADNEQLIQDVAAKAAQGVRTFVLGAPGSENYRSILSRMAKAGGTESAPGCSDAGPTYCHYDMTSSPDFGAALAAALQAIGGKALSCTYDIPPQDGSFDPLLVNVELTSNGMKTKLLQDPTHQNGWDYSADQKQILLYGPACDAAKAALSGTMTILYGCPTEVAK